MDSRNHAAEGTLTVACCGAKSADPNIEFEITFPDGEKQRFKTRQEARLARTAARGGIIRQVRVSASS
jgi:hypothetical protein